MRRLLMIIGVLIPMIFFMVWFYIRPYYSPATKQKGLYIQSHHDDTLRIAYIGDSWVDLHKNYNCEIDSLIARKIDRPIAVKIAGVSGLTSKNIYLGMFRNDAMRRVVEWGPDFCIIIAGINDSDRKMGKQYYQANMKLIIDLLLKSKITPLILEIPSFDIKFSYHRRIRLVKMRYLVSMLITCSKMDCIQDYRDAYYQLILQEGWQDRVVNIPVSSWNPNGYKDSRGLYDAGLMHLNSKGYHILDSCIAETIMEHIQTASK